MSTKPGQLHTLDQLATLTGLTKGYLSRLERGEKSPSIATVIKIAQALSVPVSTLFGEATDAESIHLVRTDARSEAIIASNETLFIPLSRAVASASTEAFLLFPGEKFRSDGRVDHPGTEMLFVVQGKIEVQFADRNLILDQGDFLEFPGHLSHQVRRQSETAVALVVVTRER